MSCETMRYMASQELQNNATILKYSINSPVCPRFQELSDRALEHNLQKGAQLARNMCFTPTPEWKAGKWTDQFNNANFPESFLIPTKARWGRK